MDLGLHGKVAIITGASAGIGEAVAKEFAKAGVNLVLTARNQDRLNATLSALSSEYDASAVGLALDVAEPDAADRLVAKAKSTFEKLHIVVNNAGRAQPGGLMDNDIQSWMDMESVKLHAMIRLNRAAIVIMKKIGWGRIINMSSIGGIFPNPKLLVSHSLSAAINNLTRGLSLELAGTGILVNAIGIGAIRTQNWEQNMIPKVRETRPDLDELSDEQLIKRLGAEYTPVGRFGTPEEIAAIAAFFASERNGFVTGSTIEASGGADRFF